MKQKHIWTSRTLLFMLILLCGCMVSLVIHIALADTLEKRITDLQDDLGKAEKAVNNAEGKLGAAHDLMDELYDDWQALSESNRDKAVDAIISLLSLDWPSLVKQGAKIGITFDSGSSLTSNFDTAVSRVEILIVEMNTAITRYYTTLGKVQNLIKEHNAGHADRGYSPWERHTIPSGPVEPWFVDDDLPDIPCKGGCGVTFPSPSASIGDHQTKCGDGENVDEEANKRYGQRTATGVLLSGPHAHVVSLLLSERSVTAGCGRDYYWCTQNEEHKIRFCNKQVSDGGTSQRCGQGYRNCMPLSTKHNGNSYKTYHDEDGDVSSGGEGSTENQFIAPDPAPTPTPSYHTCGSHETWQSGDHFAAGCGTSGHYSCDGSDHSLQASCSVTNSNGDYCTVASFYACQSHMHQYPEPQSQYMTCAYGHTYDTTVQSQVDFHRTKTCKWCGGTWKDCGDVTPYCPTWTTAHHKCSEPSHTCDLCD